MSKKRSLKGLLSTSEKPFHEVLLSCLQEPQRLDPITEFLVIGDDRVKIAMLCMLIIHGAHIPDEKKPVIADNLIRYLTEDGWTMETETILALTRLNACEQFRQAIQGWHETDYPDKAHDAMAAIAGGYKKIAPALNTEWKNILCPLIQQWNVYLDVDTPLA